VGLSEKVPFLPYCLTKISFRLPKGEIFLLLCILGPTAVGKTEIAISVAQKLDAEIVSADSRQIYKYMDIGTAKPTPEEQTQAQHHLIDCVIPDERFSVADYQRLADAAIENIQQGGKRAMLVGGAGLYFRAVVDGMFKGPSADMELRAELRQKAEEFGPDVLHRRLAEIDPESANSIHKNDLIRLIRALEVYQKTGKPISELQQQWGRTEPRYPFIAIGINRPRGELYQRIEARVDKMLGMGLLEEVKSLLERGYDKNAPAMRGFGYKEFIDYLDGQHDFQTAVELLKRNTRRYAKRQLTWFRNEPRIQWINLSRDISIDVAVSQIETKTQGRLSACCFT